MNNLGIIRISPLTKTRLDDMKRADKQAGLNTTMSSIVDRLVADEYEQRKKTDLV